MVVWLMVITHTPIVVGRLHTRRLTHCKIVRCGMTRWSGNGSLAPLHWFGSSIICLHKMMLSASTEINSGFTSNTWSIGHLTVAQISGQIIGVSTVASSRNCRWIGFFRIDLRCRVSVCGRLLSIASWSQSSGTKCYQRRCSSSSLKCTQRWNLEQSRLLDLTTILISSFVS